MINLNSNLQPKQALQPWEVRLADHFPADYQEPPNVGPREKVSIGQQIEMVDQGRRLMDHFQFLDNSALDLNPEKGTVVVRYQTPTGGSYSVAQFSGDRYNGILDINRDERGGPSLDRRYQFSDGPTVETQFVKITDARPTYMGRHDEVFLFANGHEGVKYSARSNDNL